MSYRHTSALTVDDVNADFIRLRDHLSSQHGRSYRWDMRGETFAELWARMAEDHTEDHTEGRVLASRGHDHLHVMVGGNGCPMCNGCGKLVVHGFNDHTVVCVCPECAGFAIPPASVDEALAV